MKTYVLIISQFFPKTHSRSGSETNFEESIESGIKKHTIRGNFDFWKKRFEKINSGEAVLSVRCWTGKPYKDPQKELFRFSKKDCIGIQKIQHKEEGWFVDDELTDLTTEVVSGNDGLSENDFLEWFKGHPKEEMVLINFSHFRYERFNLDFTKINNIDFDGIDYGDAPDFCDAYIVSADYESDGMTRELTDEELEFIQEFHSEFTHEKLQDFLF